MLKLLAFLPCEKLIIDKRETPTLVSIIQSAEVGLLQGAPPEIPPNAVVPMRWFIFSVWDHDADDIGKKIHQKTELLIADQTVPGFPEGDLVFEVKEGLIYNYFEIFGMPVGHKDTLKLKMRLESADGTSASPEYYYPIKIIYPPAPETNPKS